MKITPLFIHPQAILGVYDFFQTNTIRVILKNDFALPSFIMAVNGCRDFEAQKVHSSIIKSAPHGPGGLIKVFWSELMHLCKKNIHI